MTVQLTTVDDEIHAVFNSGIKPVAATWECTIHANGRDHRALYVDGLNRDNNFMRAYTTNMSITVAIPAGTLEYDIVPYRSTLEITLRRISQVESATATVDRAAANQVFRYRATMYDNRSDLIEGRKPTSIDKRVADRGDLMSVTFQLYDPNVERLRMVSVGGPFRNVKPIDLIRLLLTHYSRTAHRDDAVAIRGVTVAPGHGQEVRQHIIIPHHTPLVDVPRVIEERCGGVYPTGFQYYLMGNYWYLFAPYDVTAYERSKRTMTLINVPANRYPEPERTYRETPTQLIVLATGDVTHTDVSEQDQLNMGNGVRFIDARNVMDGFAKVEGNRATVTRTDNVSELVVEGRENGLNNVRQAPTKITSSFMTEYGRVAMRAGSFIQAVWENSNDTLLYPGMPVKFIYIQNHVAEEIYGILIGASTTAFAVSPNIENRRFVEKTALTVFVNRKVKLSLPT